MRLIERRQPRPNAPAPKPVPTPSTADIEQMLWWVAAEVRAERRFPWYVSRRPARFIGRAEASAN